MGFKDQIGEDLMNRDRSNRNGTVSLHTFSDLSHTSPAVFVYLLKECYVQGTCKATYKFRVLQQQTSRALLNDPLPGPATFIVRCLFLLPLFGPLYTEGFSHLLLSSLCRIQTIENAPDSLEAKNLATQLFLDVLSGSVTHGERILVKLLEIFDIRLINIAEVTCGSDVTDDGYAIAKALVEKYIFRFIESQSYMTAVSLLEHFSIRQSGESFLDRMMQDHEFKAAEKWATFMGKPMVCLLVKKYLDMKLLKAAYGIIKMNNLKKEFPDAYHLYKESSLKKLAEKGCWDIAEMRTNSDPQLLEYLVYLAMEAGYTEKVDELCERHSLNGFGKPSGCEASLPKTRYLHSTELVIEDILWVDDLNGLRSATSYIEGCKIIGIDCEWKPNYEKGCKSNKVSIMQIASERKVFILDLIKLFADEAAALDNCLKQILHSPRILKLGYNLQCDLQQLSLSYGKLECFKYYEMLLDIQKLFKEPRGGLSGLAKKILGAGLNKTRRNSNWEQRPLTSNQIEYAALDAAVLVHIFCKVRGQPLSAGIKDEGTKIEWKSYIVSRVNKMKVPSNSSKITREVCGEFDQ